MYNFPQSNTCFYIFSGLFSISSILICILRASWRLKRVGTLGKYFSSTPFLTFVVFACRFCYFSWLFCFVCCLRYVALAFLFLLVISIVLIQFGFSVYCWLSFHCFIKCSVFRLKELYCWRWWRYKIIVSFYTFFFICWKLFANFYLNFPSPKKASPSINNFVPKCTTNLKIVIPTIINFRRYFTQNFRSERRFLWCNEVDI